jgi:predicted transcriptional regulator
MKFRNKTDIIAQMLESASGESLTKTKIMYKAYVPHEQITYYLQVLVDNGLLCLERETRHYRTTAKGQQLLDRYNYLRECIVDAMQNLFCTSLGYAFEEPLYDKSLQKVIDLDSYNTTYYDSCINLSNGGGDMNHKRARLELFP